MGCLPCKEAPPMASVRFADLQGYRLPKAPMALASHACSDEPSAPTRWAHQSMPRKVVSAREDRVGRKTAVTSRPVRDFAPPQGAATEGERKKDQRAHLNRNLRF